MISQTSLLQILSRGLANILSVVNIGKVIPISAQNICQMDLFETLIYSELRIWVLILIHYGMSTSLNEQFYKKFMKAFLISLISQNYICFRQPKSWNSGLLYKSWKLEALMSALWGDMSTLYVCCLHQLIQHFGNVTRKKVFRVNLKMHKFL